MLIWVPINVNLYNNVFSVLFCQFTFSLSWISESPMTENDSLSKGICQRRKFEVFILWYNYVLSIRPFLSNIVECFQLKLTMRSVYDIRTPVACIWLRFTCFHLQFFLIWIRTGRNWYNKVSYYLHSNFSPSHSCQRAMLFLRLGWNWTKIMSSVRKQPHQ